MSLTARPATPDDYGFFAELHVLLATGDPVPSASAWAQRMMPTSWIYERNAEPVGYAFTQPLKPTAYVRNVMVATRAQGQGVGRFLMQHQAQWLKGLGCTSWVLNVKPDNEPALRLYRGVGMRERFSSTAVRLQWSSVDKLADARATVRPLEPHEDAAAERTFDVVPGLLSALRTGSHVHGVERDGQLVGVARFDPHFPGVMPLRLRDNALARPLLESFRPFARHDWVQLFVEGDPPLAAALQSADAKKLMDVLHFSGPL
jgi:ribosomal-protein-alanine N-acetyltransferase